MISQEQLLKEFGQRVAEIRRKKGLTQEELANAVDVHRTYVGFIEQGVRNPTIGNIYKLTNALDVSLKELFSTFKEK